VRRAISEHYQGLAEAYEGNWAYSPAHVEWMSAQIAASLGLTPSDRIADIGCGTGLFTREIARAVRPRHPLLCVDPSPAMLRHLPASPDLVTVQASLEDLAEERVRLPSPPLNAVVVKEAIHHADDPAAAIHGLATLLALTGRLLIVMMPATIDYPLFTAALRRYQELQPDPRDIEGHMAAAGLRTTITHVEAQVRLSTERYLSMVQARYMSVLSTFSDQEIGAGMQEIRSRHPEPELTFPDRFVFLLGQADPGSSPSARHNATRGAI
jgi:ubiquinone/menaquinone biosynthesis C-methylase UbiE